MAYHQPDRHGFSMSCIDYRVYATAQGAYVKMVFKGSLAINDP